MKRYSIFLDGLERYWDYEEDKEGDWVKWEDVQKLRADAVREFFFQFEGVDYRNKTINDVIREGYEYAGKIKRGEL